MLRVLGILVAGLMLMLPAKAQQAKRDQERLVAEMTAMMEFMCMRSNRGDEVARKRCVVEQGGAMKEMIRMVLAPDPVKTARAVRLIQLCSNDNQTHDGVDFIAALACVRKF